MRGHPGLVCFGLRFRQRHFLERCKPVHRSVRLSWHWLFGDGRGLIGWNSPLPSLVLPVGVLHNDGDDHLRCHRRAHEDIALRGVRCRHGWFHLSGRRLLDVERGRLGLQSRVQRLCGFWRRARDWRCRGLCRRHHPRSEGRPLGRGVRGRVQAAQHGLLPSRYFHPVVRMVRVQLWLDARPLWLQADPGGPRRHEHDPRSRHGWTGRCLHAASVLHLRPGRNVQRRSRRPRCELRWCCGCASSFSHGHRPPRRPCIRRRMRSHGASRNRRPCGRHCHPRFRRHHGLPAEASP
mmetsp:Transcript_4180/g.12623  ORF Transcript_4180/g.12623 Transcript_4180/m.12623 type:complete len:293 (+) Transcript_4180:430-1308(+)